MEIEIADWCPDLFKQSDKVAGKVKVILNKKMFLWLTVLIGKNNNFFCKFPSIKSGELFIPALGWVEDDKMERKISDEVIRKLKNRNDL